MEPGIYPDIPNHDYHHGPGTSKSQLDIVARGSLAHLRCVLDSTNDNEPTAAQRIGTAFHALVLEPELFRENYCLGLRRQDVPDAIDDREQLVAMVQELNTGRLSKLLTGGKKSDLIERILAAQEEMGLADPYTQDHLESLKGEDLKGVIATLNEARPGQLPTSGSRHELAELLRSNGVAVTLWSDVLAEWQANNGNRIVLTQDEWEQLHAMRASLLAHPAAGRLLGGDGVAEYSVYANDPETGELCRCRPDWWRTDINVVADLKTAEDASPDGFAKSAANWRYHVQDPYYSDVIEWATGRALRAFVFIVVEKKPPYAVGVYQLDEQTRQLGRQQYRSDLAKVSEANRTGHWPGFSDRIEHLTLPAWYFSRHAE